MPWNPEDDLPKGPLAAHERQKARRVIHWYERRAIWRGIAATSLRWLLALPAAMLAVWGIIQLVLHGRQ
jgi:hypothetical protein